MKDKHVQAKKDKCVVISNGWVRALEAAKFKVREHRQKIRQLNASMKIIEEKLKAHEPWPLDSN